MNYAFFEFSDTLTLTYSLILFLRGLKILNNTDFNP